MESLDEQDLWYATDDKAEYEAMTGLRETTKETATSDKIAMVVNVERRTEQKSIQELRKATTCYQCGALGHWEDECPQEGRPRRSSPSDWSSGR